MSAQITSDQIQYRKKVGRLEGHPVFEVGLIGGLHIIGMAKAGRVETLGAGPHRAVARHIAMKRNPKLEFTELNKSDHIEPEHFESLLPRYEALTDHLRAARG